MAKKLDMDRMLQRKHFKVIQQRDILALSINRGMREIKRKLEMKKAASKQDLSKVDQVQVSVL